MPPGRRQRQQRRSVLDRVAEYLSYHLRGPFVVALVGIITVGDLLCCVYYTVQFIQFLFGLYTARGTGQHTLYEPGYEQSEGRGPDMDVNVGWDQTRTETLGFTDRWLRVRPYVLGTLTMCRLLWLLTAGFARRLHPFMRGGGFRYWTDIVEAAGLVVPGEDIAEDPISTPESRQTEEQADPAGQAQEGQSEERDVQGSRARTESGKGSQRRKNKKKKRKGGR